MPVDVATIMLMFPVVSLSMAAAMLVVAWGRWRDDGLAPWAAGVLMIAVAFPLFIVNSLASNQFPALMGWATRCWPHPIRRRWWRFAGSLADRARTGEFWCLW